MAAFQNFRSALNGFNREDVVHYIEYINKNHASQLNQLNTEIQTLQRELNELRNAEPIVDLSDDLAAANERIAALEAALQRVQDRPKTENELEAYRRAERAERIANERVSQMYQQANGVLADATARTDDAAGKISAMADSITAQLSELQGALAAGRNTMKDAAAAMYAIRPVEE